MPRQNPNLLSSAANLRGAAAAIRAAVGSGSFEDLKSALTAAAGAFEQAEGAFSSLEQRLRDLGEANANDPRRPAGVLVSGDRIRGGVQVQGGLRSVMGQGMDLTFETAVGHVKSYDHGADAYLELDIDGLGVTINSHGGTFSITGTPVVLKPGTDSTTAIQLQNAAGTTIVTLDTTNAILKTASALNTTNVIESTAAAGFPILELKTDTQRWQWASAGSGTAFASACYLFDVTNALIRVYVDNTGKVGIGTTAPKSILHVVGVPVYANNAAAVAGGLTAGAFYRTGGDPDPLCVVH